MRQRVTTRFGICPPFPLQGLIEGLLYSMKRYFDGLSERLKSGWVDYMNTILQFKGASESGIW